MAEISTKMTGEETKTTVERADQDEVQANFAGEVAQQIQVVQQRPEVAAAMAKRSYTTAKIAEGTELVDAFQAKRATRQEKLGNQRAASEALASGFSAAKQALTEYRESVRLAYPNDKAQQQALGINERVPQDREKLIVYANTCATTAKKAPYAQALTEIGFDLAAFESAIAAFATARTDFKVAEQEAQAATADRNAAFQALKTWTQSFRRALRLALK